MKIQLSCFLLIIFTILSPVIAADNDTKTLVDAAADGDIKSVRSLLASGIDVDTTNSDGTTALMKAAQEGHTDVAKALIAAKADINAKITNGATVLIIAAENGHTAIVKALVAAGADVNIKHKINGSTALIMAAQNRHMDVVKFLIQKGADVNAKCKDGVTALMIPAYKGHTDIIKILIAANSDVTAKRTIDGSTALMMAKQMGHTEIVKALLEAEAQQLAKEDSVNELLKRANKEDIVAYFELGRRYKEGRGITQDNKEAKKWFKMASEQGHATAQFELGLLYYNYDTNYKEAAKWFKMASEKGNAKAQFSLGYMYASGQGVTQDNKEAKKWFRMAAEQGEVNAQANLGGSYYEEQNYKEAVKWYKMAAEQGHAQAKTNLKLMQEKGQDRTYDVQELVNNISIKIHQESEPFFGSKSMTVDTIRGRSSSAISTELRVPPHGQYYVLLKIDTKQPAENIEVPFMLVHADGKYATSYHNRMKFPGQPEYWHEGIVRQALSLKKGVPETLQRLWKVSENDVEKGKIIFGKKEYPLKNYLHKASIENNITRILQYIEEDPAIDNKDGELIKAAEKGDLAKIKTLLKAKANVNAKNKYDDTALINAAVYGHTEIVKMLLERGADINAENILGDTALKKAVLYGYTAIAKMLLERGADISTIDVNDALAKALGRAYVDSDIRHVETVQFLLERGANLSPFLMDISMEMAKKSKHTELIKLLKKYGAKE